ncbi:hypothetical protein H9L25_00560 [Terrisporobacter mayombei]|nr:hypothetical protein [Terrisporobacter mayombei]
MNIIEVMRLSVGTKIKSNVCDGKILKICEQDGVKVLKFDGDFRRIFLDNDITEAEYEIEES